MLRETKKIKIIGFDADDTLWENEAFFRETEKQFFQLLQPYLPANEVNEILFATEMKNLKLYGYGVKGFVLSMIETALLVSNNSIPVQTINKILELGKNHLQKPVKLLNNVPEVLEKLSSKYLLIIATKGDLLDQERKLKKSNLVSYFHHIEIMSDKKEMNYRKLLKNINTKPAEFMMVGNSLKSDIIPVLNIGGRGVHIPFHTTWIHENTKTNPAENNNFYKAENINELLNFL